MYLYKPACLFSEVVFVGSAPGFVGRSFEISFSVIIIHCWILLLLSLLFHKCIWFNLLLHYILKILCYLPEKLSRQVFNKYIIRISLPWSNNWSMLNSVEFTLLFKSIRKEEHLARSGLAESPPTPAFLYKNPSSQQAFSGASMGRSIFWMPLLLYSQMYLSLCAAKRKKEKKKIPMPKKRESRTIYNILLVLLPLRHSTLEQIELWCWVEQTC